MDKITETLEEQIVRRLHEKGFSVTTAESCTGGMIASRLIGVAGISDIYKEGYITYANEAKEKLLGVKKQTLESYGAVSRETAEEMAFGAAKNAGADVSLISTGIAGPGGGTEEKPVGLVYTACCIRDRVIVQKHIFQGNRQAVRTQAVEAVFQLLLKEL